MLVPSAIYVFVSGDRGCGASKRMQGCRHCRRQQTPTVPRGGSSVGRRRVRGGLKGVGNKGGVQGDGVDPR